MNNQFLFIGVNEKILPSEKAVIPAVNRSICGEGVFTSLKVKQGIPLFWEKHKERLLFQTQALGFTPLPVSCSLDALVNTLIKKNAILNCALKITIINGEPPLVIVNARALPLGRDTIDVITVPDTRDALKTYKTINRLVNNQAYLTAEKQGANDALFVNNGNLIESTMCNIFSLNKKGVLITPPLAGRGLQGIVRKVLMEQTEVSEEDISETTNGPLVLVNSLRIRNIKKCNGKLLDDGEVLFEKIKQLIKQAEDNYLNEQKAL